MKKKQAKKEYKKNCYKKLKAYKRWTIAGKKQKEEKKVVNFSKKKEYKWKNLKNVKN